MSWRCAILVPVLIACGCTGSRWARDDLDYNRKYAKHTDNPVRTVKQAFDARHVIGKRGVYAGFAGRDDPFGGGVEAGVFAYPRSWLEARIAGAVLAQEGERPLSGGGLIGLRVQPPTRVAPFVGVGGYLGWAGWEDASADSIDNNDDGFVDELGEDQQVFVAALAPEVGMHYWITSRLRLTGSADYRLASGGRETDSLFYGVSLAWLGPRQSSPRRTHETAKDWSFAPTGDSSTATPPTVLGSVPPEFESIQPPAPAIPPAPETVGDVVEDAATEIAESFPRDLR